MPSNTTIKTIITNENIRDLVQLYVKNKKEQLPIDLQNKPIGDWDVSNVTNMNKLFYNCIEFNEALDDWEVDNVTNMHKMFYKCYNFDKPLNSWIVSNVTDMEGMFSYCRNFDQPLDHWNVSNVTNMTDMFYECEMFNRSLDDWDVSNVVDMEGMFSNCIFFNDSLNRWNVSKVNNMFNMFSYCEHFNKPLNNWDVSNVTNMGEMFLNCEHFNQPLNNWDVRNVEIWDDMFENCDIEEQNKPHFNVVDARQIHKASAKINYTQLISVLKEKVNNILIPENINYRDYINTAITKLINTSDESEEIKNTQRQGLQRIMSERLNNLDYQSLSPLTRESIFYVLEYVKTQSSIFKNMYVDTFIKDCVQAYEGPDGMTCSLGALERILFSLSPACAAEESDDCKEIIGIIGADPNKLMPQYIIDWYKEHKTGTPGAFPEGTTTEQFKQSLKNYLKEKIPSDQFPDIDNLIHQKVEETAEYVGFEPDDFMRGGKKRKTKKTKKTNRKTKKTNRKTIKKKKINRKK